tara:strand:- start:81 stop:1913 length:1833 start_codon:yes stop_codon:yes gene_type:complete
MKKYFMMAIILSTSLLIFYNKGTEKSQPPDLNEISNDSPLRVQMGSKYVTDKSLWGNLIINRVGISGNYQNTNDKDEILRTIENYHRSWLDGNDHEIRKLLDDDIIRFRSSTSTYGLSSTLERIRNESRGERPSGYLSSMQLEIDDIYINSEKNFAIALYAVGIRGGARWEYSDLATILQVFQKDNDRWKIISHIESFKLDNNIVSKPPESVPNRRAPFTFDFVYPVKDLKRAIEFYTPLLGIPEIITSTKASFRVRDSYFELDSQPIDERIKIIDGNANGYAIINVDSLNKIKNQIDKSLNADLKIIPCEGNHCLVTEDLSGNIAVWRERNPIATSKSIPEIVEPKIRDSSRIYAKSKEALTAWAENNSSKLIQMQASNALWIDDAFGIAKGSKEIEHALMSRWKVFDRGLNGIDANLTIQNFKSIRMYNHFLSYLEISVEMKTNPKGSYDFFLMQVWNENDEDLKLHSTFIAEKRRSKNMPVNSMDYTAYPVHDLGKDGRYYKNLFGSEPYRDDNWFGFWSTTSVFGLVGPLSNDSWQPVPHKGNGYADLSIRSADEVYEYLKNRRSIFPVVEGIGDTSGIDPQPGYNQILAVDSEGNLINFSHYLEY